MAPWPWEAKRCTPPLALLSFFFFLFVSAHNQDIGERIRNIAWPSITRLGFASVCLSVRLCVCARPFCRLIFVDPLLSFFLFRGDHNDDDDDDHEKKNKEETDPLFVAP
jgi:hypothetical protein